MGIRWSVDLNEAYVHGVGALGLEDGSGLSTRFGDSR